MVKTVKKNRISRLVDALSSGGEFSAKQITSRFKLASPTSAIAKLRARGYDIEKKKVGNSKHNKYYINW